jgi:alcohol dehydrogenase class IV
MTQGTPFIVQWPGRLIFGAGGLAMMGDQARELGRQAFLATTRDLTELGLTERVRRLLESSGVAVALYEDVQPDPTCIAVDQAAAIARAANCQLVVGLGGGSAIDLAKGVAVAATHPGPIWDYVTFTGANARPVTDAALPVIAIPTTAGTGSEVTLGTVLDNPDRVMKAALLSPYVYPRIALVDPELTYTMPAKVTAMTGFDALTHGMEAYLNVMRRNPASDLFALETVRLVVRHLPQVVADPTDREARAQMAWAATLGGLSIALSNTTVAHAMGLPMGARLGTPHGLALSRLLPVVLTHSWQAQPARFAALADVIGITTSEMTEADKACALAPWLKRFVEEIGLATAWSATVATAEGEPVTSSVLDTLTDDVFAYMGRPVQQHLPVFTRSEMWQMFQEALLG